ncbi:MAG: peptidoglycan-binding protein [Candidatus Pacebacteria bacterium]|nr:peptidoglycan-binding protein [Candidatus Paceibacterota bacterium]
MNSLFKKTAVLSILALTAFASVPTAHVNAQSNATLQAQINQLLATISQLQIKFGGTSSSAAYANYTWTRSLTVGSTGEDVRMLQRFLNASADTQVAVSGAGSKGNETTYFGPATKAAVMKFQNKYRSEVLTPNGLVSATGYFGPSSINKANALAKVGVTPTPNPNPNDDDDLQGEGTLDTFEIDEADDTDVKEGSSDVPLAELTLEATDGDIKITRMDLSLVANGGNTEQDPWDVFEEASIWVDGDKIADIGLDNRDDYLDEDAGTFRLTNLNLVLEEDEEMEVVVAGSFAGNVDGAGTSATWSIAVDAMRYFDADGVASNDSSTGNLGDTVSFDIVERGEGEELKFQVGDDSPETDTIVVDDSKNTSGETILEYTIEAIDADIDLDRLYINVETGTAPFSSVVDDIELVINGKTFRDDSITTTGSYSATNTLVMFDIDGDITINDGDEETVKVVVDLKSQTGYQNGETIVARITSVERDLTEAEGSDDIEAFSGTVIGKVQTLISEGIVASPNSVEFTTDTQGENDTTGIFTIEFEVTAVENDFYFKDVAGTTTSTTTGGIKVSVDSVVGNPTSVSATIDTSADEDTNGVFTIREGETETITLRVIVDASASGQHRVILDSLFFSEDTDGVTGARTYSFTPINEYRTPYLYIQN